MLIVIVSCRSLKVGSCRGGGFYKSLYFAFHFVRREGWARTRLMGRTENCGLLADVYEYCIGKVLRNSTDCARGTRKVFAGGRLPYVIFTSVGLGDFAVDYVGLV